MLGDSLTAGYGLRRAQALPSRLQAALEQRGVLTEVRNAGVSGDTTAGGLKRVDKDVAADTDLCIVALGANDMMQLISPDRIARNLDAILDRLETKSIPAMLCGMRAPPWFGIYAVDFDGLFPRLSRARDIPLDPFLLDGVALNPAFVLPDRIHPNARGVDVMARRLAPKVAEVLGSLGKRRSP